jgi:DNA repair photolyase
MFNTCVLRIVRKFVHKGRGASSNPPNRFEQLHIELDAEERHARAETGCPTVFFVDNTRRILARNESPDVGFTFSVNPYRGCEHGCVYCYARPSHEYLGFSGGLDFESKVLVKTRAPTLLAEAFSKKSWTPQVVAVSGATDPYQPVERRLQLTRRCLEVFRSFRNPAAIITKNHLVTRDVDILAQMASLDLIKVMVSITSLRTEVAGKMEPRTSRPARRLEAIEKLAAAGVPVGVMLAPVVPGLTDEEIPDILSAAAQAGARSADYIMLRLPGIVEPLFLSWLEDHYPGRAEKVVSRIRSVRDGRLNDSRFGRRMRGAGVFAKVLNEVFHKTVHQLGLTESTVLETRHFLRTSCGQGQLFVDQMRENG